MYKGTNEITNKGLGFKLINSMSFGESVFSAGLFQKNRQGGSKHEIEPNLTAMKTTLEGSRGHHETPHHGGPREAARWGRPAPP
jgi:hypothetical protein